MKTLLRPTLYAAAAALLFAGAFAGFARVRGGAWSAVPLVGPLLAAPEEPEAGSGAEAAASAAPSRSAAEPVRAARLGVLDVFRIDAPVSGDELERLAGDLKARRAELDRRLDAVAQREREVDERARLLDEQYAALGTLREGMERWQLELDARSAEVERDERARQAREAEGWTALARLFEKGDAAELASRLLAYEPADAARILHNLKPQRAQELLAQVQGERWKDYAEAYRAAAR